MHIESYDADRNALLELFALADDSLAQIAGYMGRGEVLVARAIVGHLQIVEADDVHVFELKSMAVAAVRHGARRHADILAKLRDAPGRLSAW